MTTTCTLDKSGRTFLFQPRTTQNDAIAYVTCMAHESDKRVEASLETLLNSQVDAYSSRLQTAEDNAAQLKNLFNTFKLDADTRMATMSKTIDTQGTTFGAKVSAIETDFTSKLGEMDARLTSLDGTIDTQGQFFNTKMGEMKTELGARLDATNAKVDTQGLAMTTALGEQATSFDARLTALDAKYDEHQLAITKINTHAKTVDEKLGEMTKTLDTQTTTTANLNKTLKEHADSTTATFTDHQTKLDKLNTKVSDMNNEIDTKNGQLQTMFETKLNELVDTQTTTKANLIKTLKDHTDRTLDKLNTKVSDMNKYIRDSERRVNTRVSDLKNMDMALRPAPGPDYRWKKSGYPTTQEKINSRGECEHALRILRNDDSIVVRENNSQSYAPGCYMTDHPARGAPSYHYNNRSTLGGGQCADGWAECAVHINT